MEEVLNDEEMLWFQKSRLEAIGDGDRNTRYFHLSTIIRRKRNKVEGLMDENGEWVTDGDQVRDMVRQFWSHLF